ncbi:eukaryotic translation initiation factor 4G-like isoform X2 [Andrographis paniculata]|uniref:eukaryotic translation initiation factor 4G-like isoform X2 n=1 Tax=Andrographis paniculata TaxID=175694 RepID=UPI0021E7A990|nr:eukaryotic translation initiation factor 4G-like isoform X2 [Andrographis paniculata]
MSRNQSRGERNESTQYRKSGRSGGSNQQRNFPGGVSSKGGGGAAAAAPGTPNPAGRGSKKYNNNAPGGYSRARGPNVDSDWGTNPGQMNPGQNGPQQQPTNIVGAYEATAAKSSPNVKPTEVVTPINTQDAPKPSPGVPPLAPTTNSSGTSSESGAPKTPTKGDPAKSFPLQFGSISPGFMNGGVQIPARTSSAPPNLDEQKKAQAHLDFSRNTPAAPIPSVPKQPLPRNAGNPDQAKISQAQQIPKPKKDAHASIPPSVTQTPKPAVNPIPGLPIQMPFHQQHVPVQFGGPGPQIQSQAMSGTSMPLTMQMPMGTPPLQQPMFIQPHPMQSQGMLHPVQNFNFPAQMGHQLPPRLGNMAINVGSQFPQQQAGNYGSSRKSVRITHPETHEELRLDGSPGARSQPNVPPQSQPISSFPPNHPMNFYTTSYGASPIYYPPGSSVPMNSTHAQPTTQSQRLYNQVTIKPPVTTYGEKELLPGSTPNSVGKTESLESSTLHDAKSISHKKEVDTSSLSLLPRAKSGTSASTPSTGSMNRERDASTTSSSASARAGDSVSSLKGPSDGSKKVIVPDSTSDKPNQLGNKSQADQDGNQSTSLSLASPLSESEPLNTKSDLSISNLVPEIAKESSSTAVTSSENANLISIGSVEEKEDGLSKSLGTKDVHTNKLKPDIIGKEKEEASRSGSLELHKDSLESSLKSLSLESIEPTGKIEPRSDELTSTTGDLSERSEEKPKEAAVLHSTDVKMTDALPSSTQVQVSGIAGNSVPVNSSPAQDDKFPTPDAPSSVTDSIAKMEIAVKPVVVDQESPCDVTLKCEHDDIDSSNSSLVSPSESTKDKASSDANAVKTAVPRAKKKKKELYRKAEAAGTSSDLYMAYKGPEGKKEDVGSAENPEKDSSISSKQTPEESQDSLVPPKKPAVRAEPDDWEDAAEASPQLGPTKNENQTNERDAVGIMRKRYTRDFLLKFQYQCTDLPDGLQISDIPEALMVSTANILREHHSPGRNIDRPGSGPRADRRSSSLADDDRRTRMPGPLMPARGDMWTDVGFGNNIVSFRTMQGSNYGVLRNPMPQGTAQYAGGILAGPMQTHGSQLGLQRNYSDSDRQWRTGFQKGLMPSPQTPPPMMHRAEKKYEVGKVTDEEEAKQRQLKGILNKLTPQNFEKLFQQVKQVNIDNVVTLSGVISQIFDKALMEPTFCQMYADFCFHLAADLPELRVDDDKITFKRLLLNKCQEEFERGEREEEEANKAEEEGEVKQTEEEREEKRLRVRRRMLGNIRLIGELYKKRMLTERIMHECINKLLGHNQDPDEENIEALCKLMSTIGEMIDHPRAKDHMDAYFDIMARLSNNMQLSSRVRFMLKDAIDLRKNKWQQRRKVEGPKKIEEVHRDAAQERQAQTSRLSRGPSMGNSVRRGPSMDFSRAPSMLSSPNSHMGSSFRAASPQLRGFGFQDVRIDERQSFENRPVSVPLPQRALVDDSITLGPQGGLVRGMGFRGQPSPHSVDARVVGPGLNGFSTTPDRTPQVQREDLMPRHMPARFGAPSDSDQLHSQEPNVNSGNRDVRSTERGSDRSISTSQQGGPPTSMDNVSTENVFSEEELQKKSLSAIREFYSARDNNEMILCIKELNSLSFYPSMISLWITDSFERKDLERGLLAKLLTDLAKHKDGVINKDLLAKGFESVLTVLEDVVNDAPKAAEFLGRIFAQAVIEETISLSEIGQLILDGGEERGQLVETGLAAEVMGSLLEMIKEEKSEAVFKEIRSNFRLQLGDFKPPGSNRPSRIDKFV